MNNSTLNAKELWEVLDGFGGGRVVAVRAVAVRRLGASAAILASQFLYWQRITILGENWFTETVEGIERATGLTRDEQQTARARLRSLGILEDERRGVPARVYYRLEIAKLHALLTSGQLTATPSTSETVLPSTSARLPRQLVRGNAVNIPYKDSVLDLGTTEGASAPAPKKQKRTSDGKYLKAKFVESAIDATLTPGVETYTAGRSLIPGAARRETRQGGATAGGAAVLAVLQTRGSLTGLVAPQFYADLQVHCPSLDFEAGRDVWADWLQARRDMRKPVGQPLAVRHLKSLARLSPQDAVACLEYSAAKGYTGLFPERYEKGGAGSRLSATEKKMSDMIDQEAYLLAALKAQFDA